MLRYKSQGNINRRIERNQLSGVINRNLRLKDINKPSLRLKKRMLVYKRDGKFYIDHMTAYALKLTHVRAVMTERKHLIEIKLDVLYRLQNNADIEIEYQEIDRENEERTSEDNLVDNLNRLEQGEYGIGIHGIDKGDSEEKKNIASTIINEGLNLNNNSRTVLSTLVSLGSDKDTQQISHDILRYKYGNGTKVNVVVAAPIFIESENGEKIFLGFPDESKVTSGQQYEEHCILDRVCAKLKKIPPEFILGYYLETAEGTGNFTKNPKHYSNLTQKQKEDLYSELSLYMDDISKSYNDLIANRDIEKLSHMKEKLQLLGCKTYMIDNSITLAKKHGRPRGMLDTKRKRVILETKVNDTTTKITKEIKVRRILLEAYKDIKLSDLSAAKDTLREGVSERSRENEGKNI